MLRTGLRLLLVFLAGLAVPVVCWARIGNVPLNWTLTAASVLATLGMVTFVLAASPDTSVGVSVTIASISSCFVALSLTVVGKSFQNARRLADDAQDRRAKSGW